MAKLKLPFELEKPSANEYVTQADQIGYKGTSLYDGMDGNTAEEPIFTNGFIGSNGTYQSSDSYRCSSYLPCDLVSYLNIGSLTKISLNFYDKDKVHQLYTQSLPKNSDNLVEIPKEYKYFRFWGSPENVALVSIVWIGNILTTVKRLNTESQESLININGLYTLENVEWTNGLINSSGVYSANSDYSCSSFIPLLSIDKMTNNNENIATLNIRIYGSDKTTFLGSVGITWANVAAADFVDIRKLYGSDKYFRIWFAHLDKSTAAQQLNFFSSNGLIGISNSQSAKEDNTDADTFEMSKSVYKQIKDKSAWTHGYVINGGEYTYSQQYSRSNFLAVEKINKILFDKTNHSAYSVYFYDQPILGRATVGNQRITSAEFDLKTALESIPTAKYMIIWLEESNAKTARGLFTFVCEGNPADILTEKLYGVDEVVTTWSNGFVTSQGVYQANASYSCTDYIKTDIVSRVTIGSPVTGVNLNIDIFSDKDSSAFIAAKGGQPLDCDLNAVFSQYPTAKYFRIWFSQSDISVAEAATTWTVKPNGDINALSNEIQKVKSLAYKAPTGLIYFNSGNNIDDWQAASKSGSTYTNLTSNIAIVSGGISLPYGTDVYSWINRDIRNSKKTTYIDFIPNGATKLVIKGWAFSGGGDGITGTLCTLDFANSNFYVKNVSPASYTFTSNKVYRLKIFHEDKHAEVSIIDMATGVESTKQTFNGETEGNDGLFYDTWAFNPQGASVIIAQYEIVAAVKRPFLSIFGDSITAGFRATVENGINHNKYAYLIGEATGREYTTTGRGGAMFSTLFGDFYKVNNVKNLSFVGMLYSELPAYMSNYVMLTLGTNAGGTYAQYQTFVEYVLSLGLVPIVNTLPIRADGDDDKNIPANVATNQAIFQIWKDYNIHGIRFDLATSLNNDGETINPALYVDDMIHPNSAGHAAMAARARIDCPELFD